MIIVDPVTLGDVACTRASPKWVYDRTGTLVQVPANTLAVTYDPSDLTKAPYALVEPAATNLLPYSESGDAWALVGSTPPGYASAVSYAGKACAKLTFDAAMTSGYANCRAERTGTTPAAVTGQVTYAWSAFVSLSRALTGTEEIAVYFTGHSGFTQVILSASNSAQFVGRLSRISGAGPDGQPVGSTGGVYPVVFLNRAMAAPVDVYITMCQIETGSAPSSYVQTAGAAATRPADVIGAGAGLVYSNVTIVEPTYSTSTTYAKDDKVYDPATHSVYQSLIASNVNKAPTDTTAWTPRGATNRWAMLDQYNNTQTSNPDEVLLVLSPQAISQGLYLGNLFADEVRISVVDKVEGRVYGETKSLVELNSGSSFFNWAFKRIKRKDYFLTLRLPVYANALVTISLRKIGGTAKCGMCAIGPVEEFGPTLRGLSTEGKDYSSTTFNFDGTSSTVIRPYAKRMSCDVMVDNDQIDYLQARLFEIRQKPVVWVGGPYGSTAVYGRYESFKNVIQYATRSLMNLTIGGAV
jgi:hypothetical protein